MVAKYQRRISGPRLDRIDIHVEVPRLHYDKLSSDRLGEPSHVVRQRTIRCAQNEGHFQRLIQFLVDDVAREPIQGGH
jgi:magnesium chelatase family protein